MLGRRLDSPPRVRVGTVLWRAVVAHDAATGVVLEPKITVNTRYNRVKGHGPSQAGRLRVSRPAGVHQWRR